MNPAGRAVPGEIADQWIDHLHSDLASLRKCSLVCRAWVPRCRHHLFKTVTLSPGNLSRFFDLSRTPNTILPSIRTFSLNRIVSVVTDDNVTDTMPGCLRHKFGLPIFANLHSLTGLCLSMIRFNSFSELASYICEFPFLERLVITASSWERGDALVDGQTYTRTPHMGETGTRPLSDSMIPKNLRCLRLWNCPKGDILQWLLASDSLPCITTLDVGDAHMGPEVKALVSSLYAALAPHLQVLFLHPLPSKETYDLRAYPALHTLRIMSWRFQHPNSAAWVLDILQHLPAGLAVVEFWVPISVLLHWDWPQIARALEGISGLRRVRFLLERWIEGSEAFLRPRLPGVAARGLLEVGPVPLLGDMEPGFEA